MPRVPGTSREFIDLEKRELVIPGLGRPVPLPKRMTLAKLFERCRQARAAATIFDPPKELEDEEELVLEGDGESDKG